MGVYIKGMDKETAVRLCSKLSDFSSDDVIEVVRCKDCKWAEWSDRDQGYYCKVHYQYYVVEEDHFCGYGERRESDE